MTNIYQSASGDWIYFDGAAKRRFATEQEAAMAARSSPIQEYETDYRQTIELARQLIASVRELETMRLTNPEIEEAVVAAEPGALVGDSTLPKEAALGALALLQFLNQALSTPIGGTGLTPIQIVYKRY